MRSSIWSRLRRFALGGVAVGIFTSGAVLAQDANVDFKARLDALEKKNQELEQKLHERQVSPVAAVDDTKSVEKIVTDLLKAKEEEQKKKDAEKKQEDEAKKALEAAEAKANGYEVGSDLSMPVARWGPNGLQWESKNGDFITHIGGRIQWDTVWWSEPAFMQGAAPGGSLGAAQNASRVGVANVTRFNQPIIAGTTGVGVLDDGEFFRRLRLRIDGRMYEQFEYHFEVDFGNINTIIYDQMWAGVRDIPFLGTVRVGQHKVPQGLESYSSSNFLPMMERSGLFDSFWQEFAAGIYMSNSIFDQRMTWHYQWARPQNFLPGNPVDFGDGVYMHTARLTALPLYADDGRTLIHVGISGQHRDADVANNQDNSTTGGIADVNTSFPFNNVKVVRFRTRYDIRDSVGTGQGGNVTTNGIQNLAPGDSVRPIDTGDIVAPHGSYNGAAEFMAYFGPFWIQAEANVASTPGANYAAYYTQNAAGALTASLAPARFVRPQGNDLTYWGYYVQAGYFLTGENRGYDRRFGSYERVRPNENFFFTRDADGRPSFGKGAWELQYRFDFTDLDSKGINGGRLGQNTFGLVWHLNPHMRIETNILLAERNYNELIPNPAYVNLPGGNYRPVGGLMFSNVRDGQVEGLGMRLHLDY